jgi:hypothetical protein
VIDDHWHILRNGIAEGPLGFSELQAHARAGLLGRADLVWQDGLPDWVQAGTIKGLFLGPPPGPNRLAVSSPLSHESHLGQAELLANRQMLAQLRQDAADGDLLWPEFVRVVLRLNPVNRQIHDFLAWG